MSRIINYYCILCLSIIFLFVSTIRAQEPIWAKSITGPDGEYGVDADIDSHGNLFILGYGIGSTLCMDSITYYTNGDGDAFIAKLSGNRQLLWLRNLGGDDNVYYDEAFDIHVDNNDEVIILVKSAGNNFTYNGDTLSGINSQGQYSGEGVIIKIDNNGNYLWHDDGSVSSSFQNVTTDSENNVYLTGWFSSSITLGDTLQLTNPTSGTTNDLLVAKYSPDGAILWAKNVGGAAHNVFAYGHNIAIDESSNKIFVVGRFNGNITFETGVLSTFRSYSTFLVSYNTNGTELWNKSLFNSGYSYCQGIDISSTGLIGIAGYNSLGSYPDGLVGFYDIHGNIHSEETYSSPKYCRLYNLEFNHRDECFITGDFQDSLSLGSNPSTIKIATNYSNSGLIVKLSDNQIPVWTMQRYTSSVNKVTCKNDLTLFSCHISQPFVYNFGADSITNSKGDAVFAEIFDTICCTRFGFAETVCNSYTSPSGKTWTVSDIYIDTIPNSIGCDSIITIELTIKNSSTSSLTASACNSYTSPSGKIWTVSDTYIDTITNAAGCDSIITIDLTINNSSTSSIIEIACESYTSPGGNIWTVSDTYIDTIPNASGCDSIITINLTIDCSNATISSNNNLKLSLYPNPANDKVIIGLDELSNKIFLEIFNLAGQLIKSEEYLTSRQLLVDLDFPNGTYFIKISNEKGNSILFKILKQ